MKKIICIVWVLGLSQWAGRAQGFTYSINYTNYPAQAQPAFDYSVEIWSYLLSSPVPVKVNTWYFVYAGGPLAITFANGRKDFAGATLDSTWYPTTLANALAGTEQNVGEYDMDIYVNGYFNWYFGTDGNPGPGQYDFPSVICHELGHGFGFTSLAKKDSAGMGSFGLLLQSDFAPVNPSFPWPDQDTMPSIFDRFLENLAGAPLDTFSNPSTLLASQFTNNQLYFNGPFTTAANSGNRARLYAPGVFQLGTSVLHLNESTYPNGNPEELMTPFISAGQVQHVPGPMTLAMLQDMGWTLHTGISEIPQKKERVQLYPVPAHDVVTLTTNFARTENMEVEVFSADGRRVISQTGVHSGDKLDVHALTPGIYLVNVHHNGSAFHIRFIKS